MITEKVKEIKEAEAKAEQIIKEAESKAKAIKASIAARLDKLREEKQIYVKEEIHRYRNIVEGNMEREIHSLSERYKKKKDALIQEYNNRKISVVETVWKEIQKEF